MNAGALIIFGLFMGLAISAATFGMALEAYGHKWSDVPRLLFGGRASGGTDHGAAAEEPPPAGEGLPVWEYVMEDIQARVQLGLERYGTVLRTNNGRESIWDLYQELIDALMYVRQKILEEQWIPVAHPPKPHSASSRGVVVFAWVPREGQGADVVQAVCYASGEWYTFFCNPNLPTVRIWPTYWRPLIKAPESFGHGD